MAAQHADQLLAEMRSSEVWPLHRERETLAVVQMHRAFRRSDGAYLEGLAGFRRSSAYRREDDYVTDPLPALISQAFADLIWGEAPEITAAADGDQDRLDEIVQGNSLASELHRAERLCSSEREVWWRLYVDRAARNVPTIQWVSRLCVTPLWRGGKLLAVAFTTVLSVADSEVSRHVELQTDGEVRNLLFVGTSDALGRLRPLSSNATVADLPDVWEHGLPMLAGRVVNDMDDDVTMGRSDYAGVERMFLMLNEANTIAGKNARLTARKRIFADASLVDPQTGRFREQDDVILTNSQGGVMGADGNAQSQKPPVSAVELSFDASALVLHINDLTDRILMRCGVAPQLVGREHHGQGTVQAESGVALRARMLHSVLAAQGKARYWDDQVPYLLSLAQQLDALPEQDGGFGWPWAAKAEPPIVERGTILPEDDESEVNRHVAAVNGEIESRQTAIQAMHADWTEEQVKEELDRIHQDAMIGIPQLPPADMAGASSSPTAA